MSNEDDWIKALSDRNLLGLLDVLLDIDGRLQLDSAASSIAIVPTMIRFHHLDVDRGLGCAVQRSIGSGSGVAGLATM